MVEHGGHRKRMLMKLREGNICEHEYLEMFLYNAMPRRNTNDLAHRLLAEFGSVTGVFSAGIEQLEKVKGIGASTAAYIAVSGRIFEALSRGEEQTEVFPDAYDEARFLSFIKRKYAALRQETLDVYCLDANERIFHCKSFTCFHSGTVALDCEELASLMAAESPSGIVLVHNHPAGDSRPSATDDMTTKKCQELCKMHNVLFCDHYIYAPDGVYSYYRSGKLSGGEKK